MQPVPAPTLYQNLEYLFLRMQCILVRQGAGLKILGRHAYDVRV